MTQLLYKFSLDTANFNIGVLICVLLTWALVIGCTVTSIVSQPFTTRQRSFWIAVVILLPIVGLLAYLPFSFRKEDLPQLFLVKREHRKQEGGTPSPTGKGRDR